MHFSLQILRKNVRRSEAVESGGRFTRCRILTEAAALYNDLRSIPAFAQAARGIGLQPAGVFVQLKDSARLLEAFSISTAFPDNPSGARGVGAARALS